MNTTKPGEWKVEEPFDTDTETGGATLDFDFVGTTEHRLSVLPAEFRGTPLLKITEEIGKLLREIAPGVSFFSDDIELAATAIQGANGESE